MLKQIQEKYDVSKNEATFLIAAYREGFGHLLKYDITDIYKEGLEGNKGREMYDKVITYLSDSNLDANRLRQSNGYHTLRYTAKVGENLIMLCEKIGFSSLCEKIEEYYKLGIQKQSKTKTINNALRDGEFED